MAKITFVVRELNKPSELALTNLSQLVYCLLDTCSENDTTTKSDSADKKENASQQSNALQQSNASQQSMEKSA